MIPSSCWLRRRKAILRGVTLFALAAAVPSPTARAEDLVRESVPRKWIDPLLAEDLPPLKYPSYFEDLDKAKALANAGRYKAALIALRKMGDPIPDQRLAAALTRGRALAAVGRVEEALKALSDADPVKWKDKELPLANHPEAQLLRAEVLADADRPEEAVTLLKTHLAAYPDSWGGHYLLGAAYEQLGDTEAAKPLYAWFVDAPQELWGQWTSGAKRPEFDNAQYVTWLGRAVDRWATLNGKYKDNNALPRQILNAFVKASLTDADYWPAHLAAAEYYLGHDGPAQALDEVKAAVAANPNDATALDLLGGLLLRQFDFTKCDAVIDTLRAVNPASAAADLLDARAQLLQRHPREAEEVVLRVLANRPKHVEALGLLAAAQAIQLRDADAAATLKRVDEIDVGHDNATAYFEVAEQLSTMWQYGRAEGYYKTAIERAPWLAAARNGLGELYSHNGEEDKALATLDEARKYDPFNVRSTNLLKLMDMMASYKRIETPHFTVVFDPSSDAVLAEYVAEYMESIFAEVCADFDFTPPRKVLLEIFPTTDSFSVRTEGLPGLESQGASFGPVITAITPRPGPTLGNFHWARVMKHEFTHVMNNLGTEGRVPRWLTEGLAVWEERVPFRFPWVPEELYKRATDGKLFPVADLPNALLRPKKPHDGEMAYMEAFWIVRYLREAHGPGSIVKLLNAYKESKTDDEAFQAASGLTVAEFEKAFFPWAKDQVAKWGYDKESGEKYEKLKKDGEAAKDAKEYDKAADLWAQAVALRPLDLLGNQRLAGLYLATKQYDKAVEHLDVLDKVELMDNRYAKQIAKIYKAQGKWPEAERYARQAIYITPFDPSAHELLRDICQGGGNAKGLEREERIIPLLNEWIEQQKKDQAIRPGGN